MSSFDSNIESFIDDTLAASQEGLLEENKTYVSPLGVCQSAAGYYAGRWCVSHETYADGESDWLAEPWDRQSGYFSTAEDAARYVAYLEGSPIGGSPIGGSA